MELACKIMVSNGKLCWSKTADSSVRDAMVYDLMEWAARAKSVTRNSACRNQRSSKLFVGV